MFVFNIAMYGRNSRFVGELLPVCRSTRLYVVALVVASLRSIIGLPLHESPFVRKVHRNVCLSLICTLLKSVLRSTLNNAVCVKQCHLNLRIDFVRLADNLTMETIETYRRS